MNETIEELISWVDESELAEYLLANYHNYAENLAEELKRKEVSKDKTKPFDIFLEKK